MMKRAIGSWIYWHVSFAVAPTKGVLIVIADSGISGFFGARATIGIVPLKVVHCARPLLFIFTPPGTGVSCHGGWNPKKTGSGETVRPSA